MWGNIRDLFLRLTYPIRRFYFYWWVIKSIQYAWFLRSDFDWDHSYILKLLKYKLKRTRLRIVKNDTISRVDLVEAQIKHAEDLIQLCLDDNFLEEEFEKHDIKWGKLDFSLPGDTLSSRRKNVKNKQDRKQQDKEFLDLLNRKQAATEKGWDDMFNHLRKYLQHWWD